MVPKITQHVPPLRCSLQRWARWKVESASRNPRAMEDVQNCEDLRVLLFLLKITLW